MDARITIFIEENGAEYIAKIKDVPEVIGIGFTAKYALLDLLDVADNMRRMLSAYSADGNLSKNLEEKLKILNELLGK